VYYTPLYANVGVIAISLVALLFIGALFGCACSSLAGIKGYKGYFAVGFIFGIFGLIYVAGLPTSDSKEEEKLIYLAKRIANEMKNTTNEKELS
jgi:hypothetical protein